jgi:hypothetical protein
MAAAFLSAPAAELKILRLAENPDEDTIGSI